MPPDPPTLPNPADEELKLSADGDATLNCTAAGNPVPEYSWQFPHEIQQTSEEKNRNQPILTIELAGTYTCTSSNPQGRVTKVFKVIQERSKLLQLHLFISTPLFIYLFILINHSIIPSCCCFPSGSLPGTTAGILLAVFFLLIAILACVVHQKQKKSCG